MKWKVAVVGRGVEDLKNSQEDQKSPRSPHTTHSSNQIDSKDLVRLNFVSNFFRLSCFSFCLLVVELEKSQSFESRGFQMAFEVAFLSSHRDRKNPRVDSLLSSAK
jgi:hypothetical protein